MTQQNIRFGLVGGGLAGPLNAGGIYDAKGAELIAFARRKSDFEEYINNYGISKKDCYTDYKKILERSDIDAVCIATPPFLHEEMVINCAKAGKHVMVEKPISVNLNEADRMIKACEEAGVTFGVIYMYRFLDSVKKIKKALEENRLGKILLVDCISKMYRDDKYYASADWRGVWKGEGGGSLPTSASHFIDIMLYLIGDIKRLSGRYMTTIHKDIEVDDLGVAEFSFKNGAYGTIVSSTAVSPGYPRRLEIHGEKGSIILKEEEIIEWKVQGMNENDYLTTEESNSGDSTTQPGYVNTEFHRRQYEDFIEAIREGRKPLVDGIEGRRTLEFIRAIYQSGDLNKVIEFPIDDQDHFGKKTVM